MSSLSDRLERLQAGDPGQRVLIALEFFLDSQPESRRELLRIAIEAAAVPHWFDASTLSHLLGLPRSEAESIESLLRTFPMIESFRSRGLAALNVHESTRLAIRKQLYSSQLRRLAILSARTIEVLGDSAEPHIIAERLYHKFIAEPDSAAVECEVLYREWASTASPEVQQTLQAALQELENTGMVAGRPRAHVLLVIGWVSYLRGETARLAQLARTALDISEAAGYAPAIGQALCLLGDVQKENGHVRPALINYQRALETFESLRNGSSLEYGIQKFVAITHTRLGDVLQKLGYLESALEHQLRALEIFQSHYTTDPAKISSIKDLASTYERVADVLQPRGQISKIHEYVANAIRLHEALAEMAPENAAWRYDVARCYNQLTDLLHAEGRLDEAITAITKSFKIHQQLIVTGPSNMVWIRGLAAAYSRFGEILFARGRLSECYAAFDNAYARFDYLAKIDPLNMQYERNSAVAQAKTAEILHLIGKSESGLSNVNLALERLKAIAEKDPANADAQRDVAITENRIGDLLVASGDPSRALHAFNRCIKIFERLSGQDPGNLSWKRELAVGHLRIAQLRIKRGTFDSMSAIRRALGLFSALSATEPKNVMWQGDLGVANLVCGDIRRDSNQFHKARLNYEKAIAIFRNITVASPQLNLTRRQLATALFALGALEIRCDNVVRSRELNRESENILVDLLNQNPDDPHLAKELKDIRNILGQSRDNQRSA